MSKANQKVRERKNINHITDMDNVLSIIGSALSGTTGGSIIGSEFGVIGAVVGGLVGAMCTGYCAYQDVKKMVIQSNTGI